MLVDYRADSDPDYTIDWTFGTGGVRGRFGVGTADGVLRLHFWEAGELTTKHLKCATYRKAVRRLRQHLKGH